MRSYYWSILNWIPLGIYYVLAAVALYVLWRIVRRMKPARWAVPLAALVLAVLPWSEELWIAYRFNQLCERDAGVFIDKTVEVDGFYDETMRSAYENTKPGRYRFVEQASEDRKRIERVERADDAARRRALAWYAERNPGKESPKDQSVIYPISEKEHIAVLPNGVDAWRVTLLDQPTARYHYKQVNSHTPVAHEIARFENVVIDTKTDEVLGRFVNYYHGPY